MAESISVSIVTPTGTVYEGSAISVVIPAEDGYMEFKERHAALITPLGHGTLFIMTTGRTGKWIYINGGYAEIHKNNLNVLADIAENSEDIDPVRAEQARDRAMKRILDPKKGKWEIDRVRAALQRAEDRLVTYRKAKERL